MGIEFRQTQYCKETKKKKIHNKPYLKWKSSRENRSPVLYVDARVEGMNLIMTDIVENEIRLE